MAVFLVITQSFSTYKRGDIITDQNVIDAIESNPDYENYAVRAGTGTPVTYSAPIPALFGSLGLVAPDTSTVAIDSQGVLRVVSPSGLSSQNVLTALGYTPVNSNLVGANSGLATLDSSGKVTSSQLPANSSGALIYTGTWNANTNSPTLVSSTGSKGTLYKVSADGQTALDGISSWHAGDFLAFNGSTWDRVSGSKVSSVAGKTGDVLLAATDVSGLATVARTGAYNDLLSPPVFPTKLSQFQNDTNYITTGPLVNYAALTGATFTGPVVLTNLTVGVGGIAPTVSSTDNSTAIATTAFVKNQNYTSLASPNFTGTPTAPTPTLGDNTTRLATTAFVAGSVAASTVGVSAVVGQTGAVTLSQLVTGGVAPLASPSFSGQPLGPTAAVDTATQQLATTEFVVNQGYSKSAVDTSTFAPKASPSFTGTATFNGAIAITTLPTSPPGSNQVWNNGGVLCIDGTITGSSGSVPVTITSGSIDGTTIGLTTPSSGAFTSLSATGSLILHSVSITSGSSYTVLSTDYTVVINKSSGSATAVTLPASPTTGRTILVKDGKGDASTNNITVTPATGTIDGASNFILNNNYASVTLMYNGTSWSVI